MVMTVFAPRITDMNDPIQQSRMNQFMREIQQLAFKLTFLDSSGGVANGRKSYNFDAVWVAYTSNGSADTEDTVAHNLGRVPVGFFQGMPDKAAVIYNSGTAWTTTNIFLAADAATVVVNLLLY